MNSPAHVIFSLCLVGRQNAITYTFAIVLGALLPDVTMFLFYGYEKLRGVPESLIWSQSYYQPFWQNLFDSFNSIPILGGLFLFTIYKRNKFASLLLLSMIIHCLLDLPVHHDDGHRHFFPFSDFRFNSPLSYWDPNHYGRVVGLVEIILFSIGSIFLWRLERLQVDNVFKLTRLRLSVFITAIAYLGFFVFVLLNWSS